MSDVKKNLQEAIDKFPSIPLHPADVFQEALDHIQQLEADNEFMKEFMAKLGYCKHGLWRTYTCEKCGRISEGEKAEKFCKGER